MHGIVMALVEGRKGPARGGLLDGPEAEMLAQSSGAAWQSGDRAVETRRCAGWRGCSAAIRPMRSVLLWTAMTGDRRFAELGFKRQTPIGPHVADFVSFPLRVVVDVVPDSEDPKAADARAQKLVWMRARDYRIVQVNAADVEADTAAVVERIAGGVA